MMDSAAEIPAEDEAPKRKSAARKPRAAKPAEESAPETAADAGEAKSAKGAARKPRAAKGKSSEAELPLAAAEHKAPEAPAPVREAAPEAPVHTTPAAAKPAEPAPAPVEAPKAEAARTPVSIKVVGDEVEAKPGEPVKRDEAVAFDPSAILARFAPKPGEVPGAGKEYASTRGYRETRGEMTPGEPFVASRESGEGLPTPPPFASFAPRAPAPAQAPAASPAPTAAPTETPAAPAAQAEAAVEPERRASAENAAPEERPQGDNRERRLGEQQGQPNRQPQQGQPQGNRPQQQHQGGNQQQRQHQGQGGNDRNGRQQQPQQGARPGDRGNGRNRPQGKAWPGLADTDTAEDQELALGEAFNYNSLNDPAVLAEQAALVAEGEPFAFNELYAAPVNEIVAAAKNLGIRLHRTPQRRELVALVLDEVGRRKRPVRITGTLELLEDGNGLLVYGFDNYRVRELSAFVPKLLVKQHGLLRGHEVEALALPARAGETAPMVVKVLTVMGADSEEVMRRTPFTELTPYYPTRRILLETENTVGWDNLSMRCVDLLCPIGLGQRGLIVAPPRTGKTVLLQAITNSIARNNPDVHLMVLLVDERPEEVTDFRRHTKADEVVSSTFDENAESHVHAAEMVIERARRMVEAGRHVVILLDSITRLARAYNTMVPSTGKILSGGVEAGALTRPKRFFGSARNIEGGGSLTILGTALVDTGSKMDEVIFEEFKGTGNMELDLDRDLANKRIFPAINFERSGTRKEELLYHPEEMAKVYALRRAMKGVPSVEAMEMLIGRVKKTKTNAEFLMTLSR